MICFRWVQGRVEIKFNSERDWVEVCEEEKKNFRFQQKSAMSVFICVSMDDYNEKNDFIRNNLNGSPQRSIDAFSLSLTKFRDLF